MAEPITQIAKNTWWYREKDKGVYFICDVGFGHVWVCKLYGKVVSKLNEQDFINAVNANKIKPINTDGKVQN